MSSLTKKTGSQHSEAEWMKHRDTIWRRYIIDEAPLKDLLVEVQGLGICVTKAQLEYKLKQWNFRRNIDKLTWNEIDSNIKKRKRTGKESEVIHNGKRLKPEKVAKATNLYRDCKWTSQTAVQATKTDSTQTSLSELHVAVCTPAPMPLEFSWPSTLPWFRVQTELSVVLSNAIPSPPSRVDGDYPGTVLERLCYTVDLWARRMSRGTEISVTSTGLSRLASVIGVTMPELYEGENLQRAAILARLPRPSVSHELLKITIYRLSNCLYSDSAHRENWKHINDVICWSGLMRHRFDFSTLTINDVSISAFVENLFGAAVNSDTVEALDTIRWLLSCGHDPNSPIRYANFVPGAVTAVQLSVMQRRPDLLRLLLDQGADPDLKFSHKRAPLEIVLANPYGVPRQQENKLEMARLLVSRGANVNNPTQGPYPSILGLAAAKLGDVEFLKLVVGKGADVQQTMKCNNDLVRRVTALSCAAGYQDEGNKLVGKSTALAMSYYLLEAHPTINCRMYPLSDYITADVFIAAALAGNCDVIRLLFSHSPTTIATSNSIGITPLLAAVHRGMVQVCELLVELGCSLNSTAGDLSPLMLACQRGERNIVSLLAQKGASTNEALPNSRPFPPAMDFFWGRKAHLCSYEKKKLQELPFFTSLRLALVFHSSDCAITLLHYSAKPLGGEMRLVAVISPSFKDYPHLVSALVKAGGDPREQFEDGNSIISYLVSKYSSFFAEYLDKKRQNIFDSLKFLLHNGAHMDGTELPKALQKGYWRLAELLIQFGASTKARATLRSPVLQSVLLLPDSLAFEKLSQDYPDLIKYTPGSLCAAVQRGHDPAVIHQLLKKRPDNRPLHILEATAVGIAIWQSADISLVHLLDLNSSRPIACKLPFSHYDLDIYDDFHDEPYWFNCIHPDDLDFLRVGREHVQWGRTVSCPALENSAVRGSLLTYAVFANDEAAFLHLLDRGCKPDRSTWLVLAYNGLVSMASILSQRQWGFTSDEENGVPEELPLILAIACLSKEHRTAMVQLLLTAGFPATYAKAQVPPLWIAAIERELSIVQLLIDAGADVNATVLDGGWTLLYYAIWQEEFWQEELAIIFALIDAGANVNGVLLQAIRNSCLKTVNALIHAGADVDEVVDKGVYGEVHTRTPLQYAVEVGQLDIIHALIEAGADVNAAAPREAGATALQFACITGQLGIAKHLIELGADVNAPGSQHKGRTALEGAAEYGRIDMIQLLLHHGAKTTDDGRRQYVRSIALAEYQGHMTAGKMLRAYREWELEDEEILHHVLEDVKMEG